MISFKNACFSYENKVILQNFTMDIPLAGITAISGASGCGKTTLLRLISGLESLENGSISGVVPENTAFLFQENRLLPWRTVRQHITDVMPQGTGISSEEWLKLVELEQEGANYPVSLSGGMGRRLALARCLALESEILLLDEPFAGVDPQRAGRILNRLRSLEKPILLVTHEDWILTESDKVILLSGPPISCN